MTGDTASLATSPLSDGAPRLVPDLELIGAYQGSGFRSTPYLVRRADGQVAQVPEVLYRLIELVDGDRGPAVLAQRLSERLGKDIAAEQVSTLLAERLRPAGLVLEPESAAGAATPRRPARADPLLALRLRRSVIGESTVWAIAGVGRRLFRPSVIVVLLAAFVAGDVALLAGVGFGGLEAAAATLIRTPSQTLAVLGVLALVGALHECGHVSACRYGGATPGRMGVGVYIVWPAFYSDVTDAYRLSRRGRLRTDLGGVYVNAVAMAALTGCYLLTGQGWLLAAIVLLHAETAYQFLPSIRLDGHYILADIVGVPDLFSRLRPVLTSLGRRPDHPLVRDLKPWVRRVITVWVFLVVPFLAYWAVLFAVLAPRLAPAAWHSLTELATGAVHAAGRGQVARAVLDVVQIPLLVLPWVGGTLVVLALVRRVTRLARAGLRRTSIRVDVGLLRRARAPAAAALTGAAVTAAVLLGVGLDRTPPPAPADALTGPPTLLARVTAVPDPTSVTVAVAGHREPVTFGVVGLDGGAVPACARGGAARFARDMLVGREVTLVPDPTLPARDRRAYVVLADQQSYTDAAIRAGWGVAGDGRYRPGFVSEQRTAQDGRQGLWGSACR